MNDPGRSPISNGRIAFAVVVGLAVIAAGVVAGAVWSPWIGVAMGFIGMGAAAEPIAVRFGPPRLQGFHFAFTAAGALVIAGGAFSVGRTGTAVMLASIAVAPAVLFFRAFRSPSPRRRAA